MDLLILRNRVSASKMDSFVALLMTFHEYIYRDFKQYVTRAEKKGAFVDD